MISPTLRINQLTRFPEHDPEDRLIFVPGVNVIVGPGNTGKTKWLNMLDYLMGDPGKPEDAFPLALAERYDSISARFCIDQDEFTVERHWKEKGAKSKVFIDGEGVSTGEFQQYLLTRLKIPILHFPKGNPYEERAWPELSWRTLLRHIYRQQRFWADIADKQTEVEQHASLMQFLGIAEHLFSEKSGDLVQKRKKLWKLQGAKEQYLSLLDQIAKDVTDEKELQGIVTFESINMAISRIDQEVLSLQKQRDNILSKIQLEVEKADSDIDIDRLGKEWADLQIKKEESTLNFRKLEARLIELDNYKVSIVNEISRLGRAKIAGEILGPLEVTTCPACDQAIKRSHDTKICYVCGQELQTSDSNANEFIDNEIRRLSDEKQEAIELIGQLSKDRDKSVREIRQINERLQQIENQLIPVRQATSSILPPEIGIIDMEKGRLQQRVQQLSRVKTALEYQNQLSNEIDHLSEDISQIENEINKSTTKTHFSYSEGLLAEGMNSYVNLLESSGDRLWEQGRIGVRLKERDFSFLVKDENWSIKLGGTNILYFLLSYHYALLNLTNVEDCHYPGIVILDLPPTFAGAAIKDKENFIIEPFMRLVNRIGKEKCQVIITGSAFDGLEESINRISLDKIWT